MVVPPCRRLWDPRMSRCTPGPRRSPGRRCGDPNLSKKCSGSPVGDLTYRDPHLGQSSPGTPGCRAGTPRWYSTSLLECNEPPHCTGDKGNSSQRRWRFIPFVTKFTDDAAELRSDPIKFRPKDETVKPSPGFYIMCGTDVPNSSQDEIERLRGQRIERQAAKPSKSRKCSRTKG